jgi:hypothetical protein
VDQNFTDRVLSPFDVSPLSNGTYPNAPTSPSKGDWNGQARSVDDMLIVGYQAETGTTDTGGKDHQAELSPAPKSETTDKDLAKDKAQDQDSPQVTSIQLGALGAASALQIAHGISNETEPDLGM